MLSLYKPAQNSIADIPAQSPGDCYNLVRNPVVALRRYLPNRYSVNPEGLVSSTVIAKRILWYRLENLKIFM